MRGKHFWLVTTEHLKNDLLFKDDEDFKCGMNCVAVASVAAEVNVLSFILMSNHTHFVLECTQQSGSEFIIRFKNNYSRYYSQKYSHPEILRRTAVQMQELNLNDESFERAVAYVQMNSVAANLCMEPSKYPWGTGSTFFSMTPIKGGYSVGDLSARARIKLLHSKVELPNSFIVNENGYIDPSSYVKKDIVESIFKSPKRMNFFLFKSSKAQRVITGDGGRATSFRDSLICASISDICTSRFHKSGIDELDEVEKVDLIWQLHRRFSSSANQISRVTGIEYAYVSKILENG